jgi:hypothetical protein
MDASYKKESKYNFKCSLIDIKNRLEKVIDKLVKEI